MLSNFGYKHGIHYVFENTYISGPSLGDFIPHMCLDSVFHGRLQHSFFPYVLWHLSCSEFMSVQMMLSSVSFVSRHIYAAFGIVYSWIITQNLVGTTTHFRCIHVYLRMVGALMLTGTSWILNFEVLQRLLSSLSCHMA